MRIKQKNAQTVFSFEFVNKLPTIEELNDFYIGEMIKRTKGDLSKAAEMLGISRTTLWRKIRREK